MYSAHEREEFQRTGDRPGLERFAPAAQRPRAAGLDNPRQLLRRLAVVMSLVALFGLAGGAAAMRWDTIVLALLGIALAAVFWLVGAAERPAAALTAIAITLAVARAGFSLALQVAWYGISPQSVIIGVILPAVFLVIAIRAIRQIERDAAAPPASVAPAA